MRYLLPDQNAHIPSSFPDQIWLCVYKLSYSPIDQVIAYNSSTPDWPLIGSYSFDQFSSLKRRTAYGAY
jgi:hypothetical protein